MMFDEKFWEEWCCPSAPFRGKPFWSWNGELDAAELVRQARIFKEMGMGGYFMHSRTGLKTEYLGEEWFRCINACADEAEALGMEAWLYDEDRWPSGSAGGLATKESRFRMKYLRLTITGAGKPAAWPDEEHFVGAFSAEIDGIDLGDYESVSDRGRPGPGRALLVFSWEEMRPHSFYNGETYLDTMSAEATEHFLQVTHDAYQKACGDRLGRSIQGIFTDEPHRGFVFCNHHGQPGVPDPGWATPWTPRLWEAFEKAFGYDLRERLPELFLRRRGEPLSPVKWSYMEICQRLFLENWARPVQERCRALGLTLTGHALHEDSLAAQAVPCGSIMRYYEFLDVPGVDVLGLRNENFWVVKQLASVARQLGRPWLLSELYGCSGWQTSFEDHKRIGDWQALFGINLRCHHLSWYSMAGEAKRDYPASISFQSAWFREYEAVETYFSRLHLLLQAGRPECDVLLINPVESLWAQVRHGWATWLGAVDEHILELEEVYRRVFTWLCEAQVDFDYGDEEHLARLGSVEPDGGLLAVGEMRYRVVVVAGMETMRRSTLDLLRRFRAAGGQVIFAGPPPRHVEALASEEPARLQEVSQAVPLVREALSEAVRTASDAAGDVEIVGGGRGLFCQVRADGDKRIIVLLNTSESESHRQVRLRLRGAGPVTELNCLTGAATVIEVAEAEGRVCWETAFHPLQERVFVCGAEISGAERHLVSVGGERRPLEGPFAYTLDEPNIAVLDTAAFAVGGGPWEEAREILRVEKALCDRLGIPVRGGEMVQPWAVEKNAVSGKGAPVRLRFSFMVAQMPRHPVRLLIEQPHLHRVFLNGTAVTVPEQTDWLIDPCLRAIPLPDESLREGRNELVLVSDFCEGVDLEAVYLLGDFGVDVSDGGIALTERPQTLAVGDWTRQGLPFYSGRIAVQIPVGEARQLILEPMGAATLIVRHPAGTPRRILPWKPFACDLDGLADENGMVVVEWVLTRRNTFGPLHLVPQEQPSIGPNHFRSEGFAWSDDYQLVPTGLKAATVVSRS